MPSPYQFEQPAQPAASSGLPGISPGLPGQPPPPPFPWRTLIWAATGLAALLVVLLSLPTLVERITQAQHAGQERAAADAAREALTSVDTRNLSAGFGLVAKAIGPSVVHITTQQRREVPGADEMFPLPKNQKFDTSGQGSGAIVDPAGYIVTNHHVVRAAERIQVRLSNGKQATARLVGADALTDIAVLKIDAGLLDAGGLTAAAWGDSEQLEIGSFVWAVGSPFGLDHSVTFGIVSYKARDGITGSAFQSFLQTDAAVNPGNSGGPLVNVRGEIVGINTAIVGPSYSGVSFALPSNTAKKVYEELKANGDIDRGWLGVMMVDLTPELAQQKGLDVEAGVVVHQVVADSPADRAGVQPDDVILEWNSQPIANKVEISRLVAQTPIGSQAKLQVLRRGKPVTLEVRVAKRPADVPRLR